MPLVLPARPNLEWLRKTAKDTLVRLRTTTPTAKLAEAQRHVAREYGFASWRQLKAHVTAACAAEPPVVTADAIIARFLQLVGNGDIEKVRLVLAQAPALVNVVGPHPFWGGRPQPLHLSIEGKRRDMFELLLEHGADVSGNNEGYGHWSPLMLALNRRQTEMRDELLRRGARVGLLEALMLGDDRAMDTLLGDGPLPAIQPNEGSILAFARTTYAIDRLLALGAPADVKDRWGATPIDALSRLGPDGQPLVAHLIARGVPAAPREYARMGDLRTLQAMAGADPAVAHLDSVMMAAVDFRHGPMVDWLLTQGAPVNARSEAESRQTALHSAAWNGDLEMVKRLIAAGADPRIRDEQYHATAAGWAETSVQVTNNDRCADVAAYLRSLPGTD
jgi:ankyrin repeat protein